MQLWHGSVLTRTIVHIDEKDLNLGVSQAPCGVLVSSAFCPYVSI